MVIDQLTKEKHYISYITNKNAKTSEATAYSLLKIIWKYYNIPLSLTLD